VHELLKKASEAGVATYLVEAENFDELAGEIDLQQDFPAELGRHVSQSRPTPLVTAVAIPIRTEVDYPILRTSALPVLSIADEARLIRISKPQSTQELRAVLREQRQSRVLVAARGNQVAAFGSVADLLSGLAPLQPQLIGTVPLNPLSDSWALGLLYEALVRGLAWNRPLDAQLRGRGHQLLLREPARERRDDNAERDRGLLREMQLAYPNGDRLIGTVATIRRPYAEGVRVRFEHHLDAWWCVFEPHTSVDLPRMSGPVEDSEHRTARYAASDWSRERWAKRYNGPWGKLFDGWTKLLAPEKDTEVVFPGGDTGPGIKARFVIRNYTAWSVPADTSGSRS
jgi:hypothetical protein